MYADLVISPLFLSNFLRTSLSIDIVIFVFTIFHILMLLLLMFILCIICLVCT